MTALRTLDLCVIAIYFAVVAFIGFWFARRQTTTEAYFVARRSIPHWAMGLSMFATIISSITFIAYPGAAFKGNWNQLVPGFMAVGVLLVGQMKRRTRAARHDVNQNAEDHQHTGQFDNALHHFRPNDCFQSAEQRVKNRHETCAENDMIFVPAGHAANRDRDREQHKTHFGKMPRRERQRAVSPRAVAEPFFKILIRAHADRVAEK